MPPRVTPISTITAQKPSDVALAGDVDVHPEDARDEGQRQQDGAEGGEHTEDLVTAVGEHRLVGALERLDHLLEVLEHVPDAFPRIVDVVEVDVEIVRDVARLVALEVAEGGALRADDLAEVDDLLLDVRDVAHEILGPALEDLLLDAVELVAHLAQHGEGGVDAGVDDPVEQVARAIGEVLVADLLGGAALLEEELDRPDLLVGEGDDVVGPDEDVQLGGVQPTEALVEAREVQDDEEVVGVLVDLRPLVARVDVLVIEWVEVEALLEPLLVGGTRPLDVDPPDGILPTLDDLEPERLVPCVLEVLSGDVVAQAPADARLGKTRHNDWEAPSASQVGSLPEHDPGMMLLVSHQEGWRDWPDETPPTT